MHHTMMTERQRAVLGDGRSVDRWGLAKIGLRMALALLLAAPVAAAAQTGKVYRIGFLGLSSVEDYAENLRAFRQGLRDLGYEEAKNVSIEYRWAEGRSERLPALAAELVRLKPDVLVTHAAPGIRAARRATSTIPIVMGASGDPVRLGFVRSLARPGGNTTGVTSLIFELPAKRLELLREAVPKLRLVAVLSAGDSGAAKETETAARTLGVRVSTFNVTWERASLETAFTAILRDRPDALIVIPDPTTTPHHARIVDFATRNRLPTMGGGKDFVAGGGLISYGADFKEGWRLAARYVDRILKGAKPAELPVEQPTRFELAINLQTAKALGLTIPRSLLLRADQITE